MEEEKKFEEQNSVEERNSAEEVKTEEQASEEVKSEEVKSEESGSAEEKKPGEPRSRKKAGLLAIFLGAFGVHNFYLGYQKKAKTQLLISGGSIVLAVVINLISIPLMFIMIGIVTSIIGGCFLFVPIGVEIWAIIDAVNIFSGKLETDGDGQPLLE